jgi:alkylhydroperoxidase family enzyme
MRRGLTEDEVTAAVGDLNDADLPPKTVAVLRLVDVVTEATPSLDAATHAGLCAHLSDTELLEYGAMIGVVNGWQRFIEAFGLRQDVWTEATPLPFAGKG